MVMGEQKRRKMGYGRELRGGHKREVCRGLSEGNTVGAFSLRLELGNR